MDDAIVQAVADYTEKVLGKEGFNYTSAVVANCRMLVAELDAVNAEILAAILRHIEERFIDLYQSLNTVPAQHLAKEKFGNTLAFLDGVIEHPSDATPV